MTGEHLAPMTICLLASLVWAPLVYLFAHGLSRGRSLAAAELLWLVALGVAALPTIAAPALSAASLSLRPAPVVAIEENASAAADEAPVSRAVVPSGAMTAAPAAAALPTHPARTLTFSTLVSAAGLVYVYGVLLALLIYAFRALTFAREISRARPVDHPEMEAELRGWAHRLGVRTPFEIVRSGAVATVCVAGFMKPKIVVPEAAGARFSFADLVMMGAHELAHIRRSDQALFFAAAMARSFFWFNPFIKRIAARAELAAEESADALVLANGVDRRRYAACFVEGLKFAADAREHARLAVPSFTPFDRRGRRDRLDAILSGKPAKARASALAAISVSALAAGAAAIAQAAFAVEPEPKIEAKSDIVISARAGEPVRAPADGVVVAATDVYRGRPELGKVVAVAHDDGGSTRYARLESYSVKKGERVRRGEALGVSGAATDLTIRPAKDSTDATIETAPVLAPARPSAPATAVTRAAPARPAAALSTPAPADPTAAPAPVVAPRSVDLEAALAGGSDAQANLRIIVKSDVRVKSAGGRFECAGEGSSCWFTVGENSRLVLEASGPESRDLRWSGCAPSADRRSCVVSVGDHPAVVVVADRADRHAFDHAFPEPAEFFGDALGAPEGGAFIFRSENGRTKWGVRSADGSIRWSDGAGISEEERKRFAAEAAKAREAFERARAHHADAATTLRLAFNDLDMSFDGKDFEAFGERAAANARRLADRMKLSQSEIARIHGEAARAAKDAQDAARRAGRDVGKMFDETWFSGWNYAGNCEKSCDESDAGGLIREAERAEREIEREIALKEREAERVEREAEREAERAEREAEREAERAEAEAEREAALAEAEAEREAARAEADAEREEIEAELRERAEALAEAERDIAAERAEIERLRSALEAARSRADSN